MAIKIGGTEVIDDTRNITNITNVAADSGQITGANGLYISSGGLMVGTAATSTAGEIRATGDIITNYSDGRLKTNIEPILYPLDKLREIRGVYYNPNELALTLGYNNDRRRVGVIAQEVERILPEVIQRAPFDIQQDREGNEISRTGEDYKTVQYERLVPLLIEAIKELELRVRDLENELKSR